MKFVIFGLSNRQTSKVKNIYRQKYCGFIRRISRDANLSIFFLQINTNND